MDSRRNDLLFVLEIAFALFVCYVLRKPLLLIYVSMLFAVIFSPIVERISRLRIGGWSPSRGASILILLAAVLLVFGTFAALAIPPIANDANNLSEDLPKRIGHLADRVRQLPFGSKVASKLNVGSLEHYISAVLQSVFTIFQGIAGGITALITLVIMTAYFILDGRRAFQWGMNFVPVSQRDRLRLTLLDASRRVQRWLGGQLLLMLILGSASTVTFGFLHIRYFYVLGVFAGIANFVPILGPIATVLVASFVAALDSWMKALGVIVFYLVYQQVENSYLTPRIMQSSVGLPAVAVVVALLIGAELGGLLGAIVAVPTAALVATVVHEYVIRPQTQTSSPGLPRAA